jgi:hypothetical protein
MRVLFSCLRTVQAATGLLTLVVALPLVAAPLQSRLVWNETTNQVTLKAGLTDGVNAQQMILNDAGQVLHRGRTLSTHSIPPFARQDLDVLLFHDVDQPAKVIAYETQLANGLTPFGYIISGGIINGGMNLANDGTISFTADVINAGTGPHGALFQGDSAGINLQLIEGGTIGGQTITHFSGPIGGNNPFVTIDLETAGKDAIYQGNFGSIAQKASTLDVSPIPGQAIASNNIYPFPDPQDNGDAASNGNLVYFAATAGGQHFFFNDGSGPLRAVSVGDVVHGNGTSPGGDQITSLIYARVGNSGHVLAGVETDNDGGGILSAGPAVLYGTPGDMKVIVMKYSNVGLEEIPDGQNHYWDDIDTDLVESVLLDNGDVIFPSRLGGGSIGAGIFRYDLSEERVIAAVVDTMDATFVSDIGPVQGNLIASTNFAASERGHIAFSGGFEWEDPLNPGVQNSVSGLMMWNADQEVFQLLLEAGVDGLDFGSGFEVVASVGFPAGAKREDPSYHFNAHGELLFRATSQSGQIGYFVISAVPEPMSAALAAFGTLLAFGFQRQRRLL